MEEIGHEGHYFEEEILSSAASVSSLCFQKRVDHIVTCAHCQYVLPGHRTVAMEKGTVEGNVRNHLPSLRLFLTVFLRYLSH